MFVSKRLREMVAFRRQARDLYAKGYQRHETDPRIIRGGLWDHIIIDAVISVDGKYVYTKLGPKP